RPSSPLSGVTAQRSGIGYAKTPLLGTSSHKNSDCGMAVPTAFAKTTRAEQKLRTRLSASTTPFLAFWLPKCISGVVSVAPSTTAFSDDALPPLLGRSRPVL